MLRFSIHASVEDEMFDMHREDSPCPNDLESRNRDFHSGDLATDDQIHCMSLSLLQIHLRQNAFRRTEKEGRIPYAGSNTEVLSLRLNASRGPEKFSGR